MGQIIEINTPINERILTALKNNPNIKTFSYSQSGAEVELKDELVAKDADDFITDFNKQLIKKKTPQPPQGPP